jgi:hypothetical protein
MPQERVETPFLRRAKLDFYIDRRVASAFHIECMRLPPTIAIPSIATVILGRLSVADHNSRGGKKCKFDATKTERYKSHIAAERSNTRLKHEYGGRTIYAQGNTKVMITYV